MADEKIYTAEELAEFLGVHRITIIREINRGKLKAFKVGREYRIRQKALEELMSDQSPEEDAKKPPGEKNSR